jgi:hypothetical protein
MQRLPTDRELNNFERHPIARRIWDDTIKVSKEQIIIPGVMTIASFISSIVQGQVTSFASAVIWLFVSVLIGLALYILINVIRAPFVVLGRHHRDIWELRQRLIEIEARPPLSVPTVAAPPEPPRATPNIVVLAARVTTLIRQMDSTLNEGAQGNTIGQAAIVEFRNAGRAKQAVAAVHGVKAHLEYTGGQGQTARVDNGIWLREYDDETSFSVGETKALVITLRPQGSVVAPEYNQDTTSRTALEQICSPQSARLTEKEYQVTVQLVGGNGTFFEEFRFRLTIKPLKIEVIRPS